MIKDIAIEVIVPSKFSICYNLPIPGKFIQSVIVPSKFSICYNLKYQVKADL